MVCDRLTNFQYIQASQVGIRCPFSITIIIIIILLYACLFNYSDLWHIEFFFSYLFYAYLNKKDQDLEQQIFRNLYLNNTDVCVHYWQMILFICLLFFGFFFILLPLFFSTLLLSSYKKKTQQQAARMRVSIITWVEQ